MKGLLARQLKRFERLGIEEVWIRRERILAVCNVCRKDHGTTVIVEEALQHQPLPHEGCRCPGGCRCTYVGKMGT